MTMAEDPKPPEGGPDSKELEKATKRIAELEAKLKAEADEREKLESIRKEVEESRQAAKEREKKALEEQGQYKALSEKQSEEIAKLTAKIVELQKQISEFEPVKAKASEWEAYESAKRKSLLESLPEEHRATFEGASLKILESAVAMHGTEDKGGTFKGGAKKPTEGPVDWSQMSEREQMADAAKRGMTPFEITQARLKSRNNRR